MAKSIYHYTPTGRGLKLHSVSADDPLRNEICALYPDNRRTLVFSEEEMKTMDLFPMRPTVFARMAPRYYLDMFSISGMSGHGRFAAVTPEGTFWLDECSELDTELVNGELRCAVTDPRLGGKTARISFVPTADAIGLIVEADLSALDDSVRVYFLHGGMTGWNTHTPYAMPYSPDMCFGNTISVNGDTARISRDAAAYDFAWDRCGLKELVCKKGWQSKNCAWTKLDHWERKITVRAEGCRMMAAPPDAPLSFDENACRGDGTAWGGVSAALLPSGGIRLIAVGRGDRIESGSLTDLLDISRARLDGIARSLTVKSGDEALDGAVSLSAYQTNAIFGDNVFLHGGASWRYGYLGWRMGYGPLAYGMMEQARSHFMTHLTKGRITEGPDRGAIMHMIEDARPDATLFYNMYETFMDQAKCFWEYSGDDAFAGALLPAAEGCIDRAVRRVKPARDWLFENSLNTWISDSHWTLQGQCTQASAYMYNMLNLAADLADRAGRKTPYRDWAAQVKRDMFRVLWQKRRGVFGYAQELRGSRLFHPDPELADIYHPAEFGLTDRWQTYQMLDWVEANLKCERASNGGKLYWSSDWYPNAGRSYAHSTYEIVTGEEMNLALVYFRLGLKREGYDIFRSIYMSLYGGDSDGIRDLDNDKYINTGHPPMLTHMVADLPCQLSTNGTSRRNPQFGDSIGMFGRALYEGLLGIRPLLNEKRVKLTPCLPDELNDTAIRSAVLDYRYRCEGGAVSLSYTMHKKGNRLEVTLYLPVAEIRSAELDGAEIACSAEPGFCGTLAHVTVENADAGEICVRFNRLPSTPAEERRRLRAGESFVLDYPGETVIAAYDPQGITRNLRFSGSRAEGSLDGESGSGVFFLTMRAGSAEYIRPVRVWIDPAVPAEDRRFRGFREEFAAPYEWKMIDIDTLFNASSPAGAMKAAHDTAYAPPPEYSQVNYGYYRQHLSGYNETNPLCVTSDERWRSLVDENGVAETGEGIPFRSRKQGDYMAAVTMSGAAYPSSVTADVNEAGRAAYLLITGITFPMQSGVENLRVTFEYADGVRQEYPLYNPADIGDMWFTLWNRFHDTPNAGFENMGGHHGAMSSAGLDLTQPIPTDTEAHILRFRLRGGETLKRVGLKAVANDVIFALMGITVLK